MNTKFIQPILISAMVVLILSCKKNLVPLDHQVTSSAANNSARNHLPALESPFSRAFEINNAGEIVGSMRSDAGQSVAFTLKNNVAWFSPESVSPNGLPEIHFSINDPGDVAGHKIVSGGILPVLWRHGQTYDLQPLAGQQFAEVYDINNQGQLVGESLNGNFLSPTTMRATLFSLNGDPIDLGTLGGAKSSAISINDYGDIVGLADNALDNHMLFCTQVA